MMRETTLIDAGWYAISQRPAILRWWDGRVWTVELIVGASKAAQGTRISAPKMLSRERMVATFVWVMAGLWLALAVFGIVGGGRGLLWALAPVPFVIAAVILENRLRSHRRLLASDAPPPFGLLPVGG